LQTWNGAQGFGTPPSEWNNFYVPYHSELNLGDTAGAGYMGTWWEERGFTLCTVDLSGHMIPQYQPSAAYRHLEYLLGRISSLSEVSDFTVSETELQFADYVGVLITIV
jgi:carboxypeptidase D